jgi:hypothetical protein
MRAFCNRFALLQSVLLLLPAQAQDLSASLSQPSDIPELHSRTALVGSAPDLRQVQAPPLELITTSAISSAIDNNGQTIRVGATSTDGRFAAFVSQASNLVSADRNAQTDIFVVDQTTHAIELISMASDGSQANAASFQRIGMSGDGSLVAFTSNASNLVSADANQSSDVFVRNRSTGTTTLGSQTSTGGFATTGFSSSPEISRDGRFLCFHSSSAGIVAGDSNPTGATRAYRRDLSLGTTQFVSVNSSGLPVAGFRCSMSADGRFVAFDSNASDIVAGDSNNFPDVFVRDMQSAATVLASRNEAGAQLAAVSQNPGPNGRTISADGSVILWLTTAPAVAGDTNGGPDVVARNWQTGETTLVSRSNTTLGMGAIDTASMSDSGRKFLFSSRSPYGLEPEEGAFDVFLRDLDVSGTGTLVLLSKNDTASIRPDVIAGVISGDGSLAWWHSQENRTLVTPSYNDTDSNLFFDAFYHALSPTIPSFAKRLRGGNTAAAANNHAFERLDVGAHVSNDGRYVAFSSLASNMVANDTNNVADVFVRDRQTGATTRISVNNSGAQSSCDSDSVSMSQDGNFVAFLSCAELISGTNAVPGPITNVYRWDRATNALSLVSRRLTAPLASGGGASSRPQMSADGTVITFLSDATDLTASDSNGAQDAFTYDFANNSMTQVRGENAAQLIGGAFNVRISPNGRYLALGTSATNAIATDTSDRAKVIRVDRTSGAVILASANSSSQPLNFLSFVDDVNNNGEVLIECLSANVMPGVTQGPRLCVKEFNTNTLMIITGTSAGTDVSNEGRFLGTTGKVVYVSRATNLGPANPEGLSEIFLFDRANGSQTMLSTGQSGNYGNDTSDNPWPSANGQHVVFLSFADNLAASDGNGRFRDVFYLPMAGDGTDMIFASGFE